MLLSPQFPELFREETYAINLQLNDNRELDNPFDSILASMPIDGLWTKEYSVVPIGELGGRKEAEPIKQKNMTMGYTCYGSQSIEASGKVSLTKTLEQRGREFKNGEGVDEARFSGYLADTVSRGFISRKKTKWHKLTADIFNLGGIAAGDDFYNHRLRTDGLSDLPNTPLQYDGVALFALPSAPHPSFATGLTVGPGSKAVGTTVDMAGAIADTGGYFNAFQLPPSYWALKRVYTHFCFNMGFDENDVRYMQRPDTLLISSYNKPLWDEILKSRIIEPRGTGGSQYSTNRENIFVSVEGYQLRVVESPFIVANTWYVGKANSGGVYSMNPTVKEDPWAYYRDEDNRSYWISYEDQWGFLIRNWRCWCAGAISTDGATAPTFDDVAEDDWDTIPTGV